jgi:hypothetical protein
MLTVVYEPTYVRARVICTVGILGELDERAERRMRKGIIGVQTMATWNHRCHELVIPPGDLRGLGCNPCSPSGPGAAAVYWKPLTLSPLPYRAAG